LSLRALSERSGIPVGTLSWWSHKLRSEAEESAPAFVEVIEAEPSCVESEMSRPDSVVELRVHHPSGVILELRGELAREVARQYAPEFAAWS